LGKPTDAWVTGASLYLLPVRTRIPLKFGTGTVTAVTCARVRVSVRGSGGQIAEGWGETPLSVPWVWPSEIAYDEREQVLRGFCLMLAEAWAGFDGAGHPMETGNDFQKEVLPALATQMNHRRGGHAEPMPWLAALVCCSPFDIALHDAYGVLHRRSVYETYGPEFMDWDLAHYLEPAVGAAVSFRDRYPADFLAARRPQKLDAWHLVGGLDLLEASELTGSEPHDGYPVVLTEWIARDGLRCLKVKLRGTDTEWDYGRLVRVGQIAISHGVDWLTMDLNCTVTDPEYVNAILDRLMREYPRVYGMVLYVEQPFPYDLDAHQIDVHSVSARKPLFMDESAHDWRSVRLGRELGWTGVALKTCKTQTGALLSLCWAKAHGMTVMVQDLTNPMLAQIPHVLLAAYAGTVCGVETNAMQFYPEASLAEEVVHPGLYRRRDGQIDLSSIQGPGFGYRLAEVRRRLPHPVAQY